MHKTCLSRLQAQRGASLAVALVVITVLMLSGVAAFYSSGTQFRLAGNLQYQNAALNQTETAVAATESNQIASSGLSPWVTTRGTSTPCANRTLRQRTPTLW